MNTNNQIRPQNIEQESLPILYVQEEIQGELTSLELNHEKFNTYSEQFFSFFEKIAPNIPQEEIAQFLVYIMDNPEKIPEIQENVFDKNIVTEHIMENIQHFIENDSAEVILKKVIDSGNLFSFFEYAFPLIHTKEWAEDITIYAIQDLSFIRASLFLEKSGMTEDHIDEILLQMLRSNQYSDFLLSQQLQPQMSKLKKDPAFSHYQFLFSHAKEYKFPTSLKSERDQIQFLFILARNIYYKGIEITDITPEIVQENIREYFKKQKQYENINIFKKRSTVLLANSEIYTKTDIETYPNLKKDPYRFGKKAVIDSIQKQGGKIELFRPEDTAESALKIKSLFLQTISEQTEPFTFLFDGHGEDKEEAPVLKIFKDRKSKNIVTITGKELAESYRESLKKRSKVSTSPDIFIISSCQNYSFVVDKFVQAFQELNTKESTNFTLPVFITASEYGQYGFSNPQSSYGNTFLESTLQLKNPKIPVKIKHVIENEAQQEHSNPSLFIPGDSNQILQIAEKKEKQKNSST